MYRFVYQRMKIGSIRYWSALVKCLLLLLTCSAELNRNRSVSIVFYTFYMILHLLKSRMLMSLMNYRLGKLCSSAIASFLNKFDETSVHSGILIQRLLTNHSSLIVYHLTRMYLIVLSNIAQLRKQQNNFNRIFVKYILINSLYHK